MRFTKSFDFGPFIHYAFAMAVVPHLQPMKPLFDQFQPTVSCSMATLEEKHVLFVNDASM